MKFVANVTDAFCKEHRVEVEAEDQVEAVRLALASVPRSRGTSVRPLNPPPVIPWQYELAA